MAGEVVRGWPGVVRGWRLAVPDGQRRKVGAIGVSAGRGGRPLGRLLDPGLAVVLFFRTTHDVGHNADFHMCAGGDGGRVHERIVGSAQSLRV